MSSNKATSAKLSNQECQRSGRWQEKVCLLFFILAAVLLALGITDEITRAGNESSRLAAVQTMVDQGTFAIDKSIFRTVDAGKIDGHFYSDKPIVFTAWLAVVYSGIKNILNISFANSRHVAIYLINLIGISSFTFGLCLMFFARLKRESGELWVKSGLAFSLVFCTWIFSYTVSINNHTVAAFLVFLLFLLIEKFTANDKGKYSGNKILFCAGVIAGLLCAVENPVGGIFSLVSLCCIVIKNNSMQPRWKTIAIFFAGGLIPAIIMGLLDYCAWGNILPVYLIKGAYNFEGNIHSSEIAGLRSPGNYLIYLFNITLGTRGLFSHMPFLILIFPALMALKKSLKGNVLTYFLFGCGLTIIFYTFFTGDYGGWAYGFRFLIPIIPILYLAICIWLLKVAGPFARKLSISLLAAGLFSSMVGAYNPWPVCDEGASTNKNVIDVEIKSPFKANLLCMQYEIAPRADFDSALYNRNIIRRYLPKAFANMRRIRKPSQLGYDFVKPRRTLPLLFFTYNYLIPLSFLTIFGLSIFYIAGRLGNIIYQNKKVRITETYIFYVGVVTLLVIAATGLVGGAGILMRYCLTAVVVVPALWLLAFRPGEVLCPEIGKFGKEHLLLIIPLIFILLQLSVFLPLVPNGWDAMTYHLYIPLRWVQAGKIFHVPTVFGDNAAAYAPLNGSLLYAAFIVLTGKDFLLNCTGIVYLIFCSCVIYGVCRDLKIKRIVSLGAAGIFIMIPSILQKAFSADVDIMALAFISSGFLFLMRLYINTGSKDKRLDPAFWCALSLGLSIGTKSAYAVYGGTLALVLMFVLAYRKRFRDIFIVCVLLFVCGGFWYARNLLLYGNPIFPVDFELAGIRIFSGAYGTAALCAGEFHSSDLGVVFSNFLKHCNWLTGVILIAGLAGGMICCFKNKKNTDVPLFITAFMAIWILVYYWVIPHNLQIRFLFPVLPLSIVGLAMLLDGLKKKQALVILGCIILFFAFDNSLAIIKTLKGFSIWPFFANAILFIGILLMSFFYNKRLFPFIALIALLMFSAGMKQSDNIRAASLRRSDFGYWAQTYLPFNKMQKQQPLKIAYTGLNIPYTLVGTDLANEVFYCNTSGSLHDGFYDFWKDERRHFDYHKPGLYRQYQSIKKWLDNLMQSRANILVVFKMHPVERSYLKADKEGFPIEKHWADSLPNIFERILATPSGCVYLIKHPVTK